MRGLSFSEAPLLRLVLGELATGMLIGLALGLLALPVAWLAFDDLRLAAAVALSILAAGAAATSIGLLLPWALARTRGRPGARLRTRRDHHSGRLGPAGLFPALVSYLVL